MTEAGALIAGSTAAVVLVVVGIVFVLRAMMRRVVAVSRPRRVVRARASSAAVELPRSPATLAPGSYGLWFGNEFRDHAVVSDVVAETSQVVTRGLVSASAPTPAGSFAAHWTGHTQSGPGDAATYVDAKIPLRDGTYAPAWLYPSGDADATWVIHVQGIRTSRLVTLRSVEPATQIGCTSLVITYRGAGDGPTAEASRLGEREWTDLADAVRFARQHRARRVVVVAWSMGAGLALELARQDPSAVDDTILICPATDWPGIVRHAATRAHLPRFVADAAIWGLGARTLCKLAGLEKPLDLHRLDWTRPGAVNVPVLVVHSRGDGEIPFGLSEAFADAHPRFVTLVETAPAPHGWEANVDPTTFSAALQDRLRNAS